MDFIGNTPLVKLRHLTGKDSADVYVKLEGANPTGSMKDRMALSLIEGAERRGELGPARRRGATPFGHLLRSASPLVVPSCFDNFLRPHGK